MDANAILLCDNDAADQRTVAIGVDIGGAAPRGVDVMRADDLALQFADRRHDAGVDDRDGDALPGRAA